MKKIITIALMTSLVITSAFAGPTNVSNKVNTHFTKTFHKATNINWKVGKEYDKATFELNNETITVFYNKDGDLIGSSKTQAFDKLPKAAIETITRKYTFPEYQLTDCIEFVNANNEKKYYVSFETQNENIIIDISIYGTVTTFLETSK